MELGNFRTRIGPDDALVRDHRLHGVPAMPAVSALDAVLRAAELRGIAPDRLELREVTLEPSLALPDGAERRLDFRTGAGPRGAVLSAVATGGADRAGRPVVRCTLVPGEGGTEPEPLDLAAVRRALGGESATAVDADYEAADRAGAEYTGSLRAQGVAARLADGVVAELTLAAEARADAEDFLVHPAFLVAATVIATGRLGHPAAGARLTVRRVRARRGCGTTVLLAARPAADGAAVDVVLHDGEGRPVVALEGLAVEREPAVVAQPPARRRPARPLEIAVVGMSGRYPGAADLDTFWTNLREGRDAVTEVPAERWRPGEYPDGGRPTGRFGAFLDEVDAFDPMFFRIPPSLAPVLDPQERLFLQTAYAAVEHAGYQPADFAAPHDRVGVFAGSTWADYRLLGAEAARRGEAVTVASVPAFIANRVSYYFGFTGPSMTVDTACSASLTALHLACRSLAEGECDAALVGGVNLILHPDKFLLLNYLNMASSDGRCRSFGAGGDGYVPGEGVGALFLKPREQALADGDTVHGVILGTAVSHGGRAAGFTVPNPNAQADAIGRALEQAGVDPDSIGYVEGHGTGTALGDPVELVGLHQAFAGRTEPCALGSVKSNVGHLEAAAGVAAVSKVLLQLRHGAIPRSLHSTELNPEIDFAASPFRVPQETEPWPRPGGPAGELPRRAGVSSFGAGGSNAHVVLQEHVEQEPPTAADGPELLPLSARTPERLRAYANRIAEHLRADRPGRFRHTARTLQAGRQPFEARLALVAASAAEAVEQLDAYLAGGSAGARVLTGTAGPARDAGALTERYRAGDLHGAAELWVAGATPDWTEVNGGPERRVPLPGYPFERKRFWIEEPPVHETPPPSPGTARADFDPAPTPVADELEDFYPDLDRFAAVGALHRFRDMGLPAAGGSEPELIARMGVLPGFARFVRAAFAAVERHGGIRSESGVLRVVEEEAQTPGELRSRLLERFPQATPFVRLVDVCLDAYPRVLRGERSAAEVLFPGASMELMAGIYHGNRAYDFYSDLLARCVDASVARLEHGRDRPVRVLEIGAGTGGTSRVVLERLARNGRRVEFHYTDVGGSFLAHGRRALAREFPFVSFRPFDLERDPVAQGYEAGSLDIVLAANAVHTVSDVAAALERIRLLLAPTGRLVLSEATELQAVLDLTLGLLDGWHRYQDPERRLPNAPLLSAEGWRTQLERAGFTGVRAHGPGLTADPAPRHRVIVAEPAPAGRPRAVPAAAAPGTTAAVAAAPAPTAEADATALERQVLEIVADGLGALPQEIRATASFAEYGVDSILAVRMTDQVNRLFGTDLRPTVLFDHPSVRGLTEHLISLGARPTTPSPVVAAAPESTPAATPEAGAQTDARTDAQTGAQAGPDPAGRPAAAPTAQRGRPVDIAVIGMSGRFPGADDYRALWRNLAAGRNAVGEVPAERWDVGRHYQPWPPAPDRTYSRWGGYLDGVDRFDPLFFNIVPAEADFMDPQHRLFLEESWKAVEDAGIDAATLRRSRTGVFVGAPWSDYLNLIRERGQAGSHHVFTGNSPAILPARVAYHLDLTGPSVGIDTACSSALVALQQACRSLAAGECELAVAGGVAVFVTPEYHRLASSLGMLSPQGQCRAFDRDADGFVIAEGVGAVVLKPLDRALADGDPIHGVIKAIGVNQDGRTNGITAPSARSQTELELEVYASAGIDPATIGYVETHGTGTKLGDPIEIEALTAAFRHHGVPNGRVAIGSVKSNLGHTSHAAGMAGLFKVLLALGERSIPPSLHFDAPNPLIGLADTPFFVNTELREWRGAGRRAALSSFGFSGTNAHLVVEEHPDTRPGTRTRSPRALIVLSARTEDSLRRQASELAAFLAARPGTSPHDVAATLQLGRTAFEHRLAFTVGSPAELAERLGAIAAGGPVPALYRGQADPDARPAAPLRAEPGSDLEGLATAWTSGAAVDFSGLYEGGAVRRINLPGYAFARDRHWLPEVEPAEPAPAGPTAAREGAADRLREVVREQAREAVRGAVAEQLGVSGPDVDPALDPLALGLDRVARDRAVAAVNRSLGIDLSTDAFGVRTSVASLARLAAEAAPVSAPTPEPAPVAEPVLAPEAEPAPVLAPAPVPEPIGDLRQRAEEYLIGLFVQEARLPADRVRTRAPFQDFGIDSVLIARLNSRLEEDFGTLPATVFFEYRTIRELAGFLAGERAEQLAALAAEPLPAPEPVPAPEPRPAPESPAAPEAVPAVVARPSTVARPAAAGSVPPAERARDRDIAVIGMSGRYPMANDNDEFWANLVAGRDCIVEVPADRWDHSAYLSDDPDLPGTTYAKWGGFIDDVDKFDARFFNIPPVEAEGMDPQQRLFLEAAWAALEDGGYTPERARAGARRRRTKDVGVFAGVNYAEYQLLVDVPIAPYWAVANRVSYHLGFNGPSFAVDTACSASLTAIHLACQSLRNGECGYAIAGGVNISIHPGKFLMLGSGRWASTDGRCRTFGAGGDGYVPGEGVVALVLKPLADARADGDRIYGVIRSSEINHDGRTNGFSVPNPNAQAELILEALDSAGVDARRLSYVEAHGTGTSLGDPIEITGLTKAYRRFTPDRGYCTIGSAKGSVGHLEAAAGAAGLVKTLLQLQHGTIAPSPHSDPPNPNIDFENSPFRVAREAMPWVRPAGAPPRLAAVSSFGAGGSNAHVIVEEEDAPRAGAERGPAGPELVLLSARRADRLEEQARRLLGFLRSERGAGVPLSDVAWTLQVGREVFEHRLAVVASSTDELARRLEDFLAGNGGAGLVGGTVRTHEVAGGESESDREYLDLLHRRGDLGRVAELWAGGWLVDWEALRGTRRGQVVSLPGYPFSRDRHWIVPEEYRRPQPAVPAPVAAASRPVEVLAVPAALAAPAPAVPAVSGTDEARAAELEEAVQRIFADLTKLPVEELDVEADFLDFGFDSVTTVRMLNRLMKQYGVRIPATAVDDYNTIRDFSRHLLESGLITSTDPAAASADAALPTLTSASSSVTLNRVLTEPARAPHKFTRDEPFPAESVFITGATGVLGGKLLHDLLKTTGARITCLVRGGDTAQAAKRLRHFVEVYDPEGRLAEEFDRRVTPVLGDVGEDRFGLDEATWSRLAAETDVTIHNAAVTALVTFYESLAPVNVDGTARAIDFALASRHKYLVYVSSFAALGDYLLGDNVPYTEHDLELGQEYDHLPYQETKYHSEKLVRAASERGLVWNIFRPGDIMGESGTGRYPFAEVSVKGAFYDFFKTFIESGTGLLTPINWDITPVDYVSAGMLHLALKRPSYGETYHLTNPDHRSLFEAQDYIRDFGYDIRFASIDEFGRMARERAFRHRGTDEPYRSQTLEMIQYAMEVWGKEHYELSTHPDCAYTRAILAEAGIDCPPIAELMPVYLRHCIEVGYLRAPDRPARAAGGTAAGSEVAR
ncbi:thioester reductase domain-containing protein [Kitasatospora sp. NPDC003701]